MQISVIVLSCSLLTTWLHKASTEPSAIVQFFRSFVPRPEVELTLTRTICSVTAILAAYLYYEFIGCKHQYTDKGGSVKEWFDAAYILADVVLGVWIGEGNHAASVLPIALMCIIRFVTIYKEELPLSLLLFDFCVLYYCVFTGAFPVYSDMLLYYTQLALVDDINNDSTLPPESNLRAAYMPTYVIFGVKICLRLGQYFTGGLRF